MEKVGEDGEGRERGVGVLLVVGSEEVDLRL